MAGFDQISSTGLERHPGTIRRETNKGSGKRCVTFRELAISKQGQDCFFGSEGKLGKLTALPTNHADVGVVRCFGEEAPLFVRQRLKQTDRLFEFIWMMVFAVIFPCLAYPYWINLPC